jgi:hypothetical protein
MKQCAHRPLAVQPELQVGLGVGGRSRPQVVILAD